MKGQLGKVCPVYFNQINIQIRRYLGLIGRFGQADESDHVSLGRNGRLDGPALFLAENNRFRPLIEIQKPSSVVALCGLYLVTTTLLLSALNDGQNPSPYCVTRAVWRL